jgi:hypothetical protein
MEKALPKVGSIFLFFILMSSSAFAINLGTVVKNKIVEISGEESEKASILFWNVDEESYNVKLSVKQSPKDWIIIIDPDYFVLNKFIGEEHISLSHTNEVIKAKVVNVFVKTDKNTISGIYPIVIRAETEVDSNGGINVVPERLIEFDVDLKTNGKNIEKYDDVLNYNVPDIIQNEKIKEVFSEENKNNLVFVLLLSFIFLIIIYKRI